MTGKKWADMTESEKQHRREYMSNYMKNRYHQCGKFRKKIISLTRKSNNKNREKRLQQMHVWWKNNKEYMKEINHLRYVKETPTQINKRKEELAKKYGKRSIIRCDV